MVPTIGLAISEGKTNQDTEWNEEIQEAILWYNRVLGFHVEGGHGNQSDCAKIYKPCLARLICALTNSFASRGKIYIQQYRY